MTTDPVRAALGRRLRLGVIGGGPGSFIGSVHRRAARRDDHYELVAGALSSDPARSQQAAVSIGIPEHRAYPTATAMIEAESARPDGIDVVAIMTPNDTHFEYSIAALAHGIDVICDKPMTNTLEEAEALAVAVEHSGLVFCLTHNYSGYPLVRQARAMVADGQLGTIRLVQVEYVQGGKADESRAVDPTSWKFDPVRGGPSRVMGDIGTHAHHLVRFITGLEVTEVAADIGAIVPGRTIDDFAGALLRLEGGARSSFWVTQAAAGVENSLRIRVSGSRGSLEWQQEVPQRLLFTPLAGPAQRLTPNGPGTLPLSARCTRLVAGHPEGFADSFATLYSDAADAIAARRTGVRADPLALHFPDAQDGLRGVRFVDAVIASSASDGNWTAC